MALTPRSIRLDIRRIVIDGLPLAARVRFARAFEDECASALAGADFRAGAVAAERVDVRYPHDATPEAIGRALARGVVKAVIGR